MLCPVTNLEMLQFQTLGARPGSVRQIFSLHAPESDLQPTAPHVRTWDQSEVAAQREL